MKIKVFYNCLIILLVAATVYFAWKWVSSDSSGESQFAIITGLLIPIVFYLRSSDNDSLKERLNKNELSKKTLDNSRDIQVKLTKKSIRAYTPEVDYGVQLEVEIFAIQKMSLKSVSLSLQEVIGYDHERRTVSDLKIFKSLNEELLSASTGDFFRQKLNSHGELAVNSLILEEFGYLFLTIAANIPGERLPDGWEGLSLENWQLKIFYNGYEGEKDVAVNFKLDIHHQNPKTAIQFRFDGYH
jgi:hypothetical protein